MTWTSRERVVAAINHREPDRVPIDVQCGLDFYLNLKAYLSLDFEEELAPSFHREVVPHPIVCEKMGWDAVSVKLVNPKKHYSSAEQAADEFVDAWGVGRKRISPSGGGSLLEAVSHPLAEAATLDDLEAYDWPDPFVPGMGEATEKKVRGLFENTDLALIGRFGGTIIETAIDLMGFETWLVATVTNAEFAGALLDRITDTAIKLDRLGLEAAGKYLQIFKVSGDDLGMQTGPLYSPKIFRELLLPRLKRRWGAARKYIDEHLDPSMPLMFHTDGGIRPFIPDMIKAGLKVLNPVQPNCAGMDTAGLKRDFGEQLVFHGGIDVQNVLPFGSVDDVRADVYRRIMDLGPGGGYILSPSHFVQADISPENIVAMTEAAHEFGQYPLIKESDLLTKAYTKKERSEVDNDEQ
jgi:uroporphyrinogen decarboxylase